VANTAAHNLSFARLCVGRGGHAPPVGALPRPKSSAGCGARHGCDANAPPRRHPGRSDVGCRWGAPTCTGPRCVVTCAVVAGRCRAAGFGLGDVPMEATRSARPMPIEGGGGGDARDPGLRPAVAALPWAHAGLCAAVAARLGRLAIERTLAIPHGRLVRGNGCASRDR
jgi:hypothetical protein